MNIKHRKKWRRAPWDPNIMIPYMSYYLCESYRDVSGKACKRTVLNIGELEGFSEAEIHELGKMLGKAALIPLYLQKNIFLFG